MLSFTTGLPEKAHLLLNQAQNLFGSEGEGVMDTILSFVLVVLFSAWIFRLKTEIYTLEKLVGVGSYASPQLKPSLTVSDPVAIRPVYDRAVNPVAAPHATPLPPNTGKTTRKGGVPVWTLEE